MSNSTQIQTRSSFFARVKAALSGVSRDRRGATTVEYLVLLAFVALAGITAVTGLGQKISKKATDLGGNVESLTPYKK
jgi:Flp pilus assembly pilin Flp